MSDMTPKTAKPVGSKPASPGEDIDTQLQAIRDEVTAMAEMMSGFISDKMNALGATAEASPAISVRRVSMARFLTRRVHW